MGAKVVTIGGFYEYLQHVFLLAQNDVDLETVYGVNMQDEVASLPWIFSRFTMRPPRNWETLMSL